MAYFTVKFCESRSKFFTENWQKMLFQRAWRGWEGHADLYSVPPPPIAVCGHSGHYGWGQTSCESYVHSQACVLQHVYKISATKPKHQHQPLAQSWRPENQMLAKVSFLIISVLFYIHAWDYYPQINGASVGSWSPMISNWLFFMQYQQFLSTCGSSLEVVLEFEWRAAYFGSLRTKLNLARLGGPKWVWPSLKQYRMCSVQTCTPTTKHAPKTHRTYMEGVVCKTTNSQPRVMLT